MEAMDRPRSDLDGPPETETRSVSVARTEPEDVELLSWADVVRFIRRNLWTILGASLGLASLTVLILGLLRPPEYEAVATLVLTPQRFRSQLKPPILPVQGYQRLLESNAVVAETAKRLRDQGVLKEGRSLRIGHELMTRIFVSQRAEETTLAPVIELVAEASTPEAAAAIATTWSEVFLERAARIQEDNVAPMLSVIEGKYQEERRSLL
jgi:capsular polysaccharide biosynthesis protein